MISFWVYSPRSLVSLLAEPDLPELNIRVETPAPFQVFLSEKPVGEKGLPLEKGWNHFSIKITQSGHQKWGIKFDSKNKDYLQAIRSSVLH
jgi:hypothetical protein